MPTTQTDGEARGPICKGGDVHVAHQRHGERRQFMPTTHGASSSGSATGLARTHGNKVRWRWACAKESAALARGEPPSAISP